MTLNKKTGEYLEESNKIYQDLLGYKPEQTSLQQIPKFQWGEFSQQIGLNSSSSGVYLPRNQTAVIPCDTETTPLSLFHEYFGHGLYCEQSLSGRHLVSLEKRLLEEEKQEFQEKQFKLENLQEFRQENPTFQELDNFRRQNLRTYEGFAVFTEFLLSREFDLKEMFEIRYGSLSNQDKKQFERIASFNKEYGDLATFYAQELARITTPQRAKTLLRDIYKGNLQDIRFALLYGSRKEFSDIDIFVVSDSLPEIETPYIDVVVHNHNEFEKRIELFDVVDSEALTTGEFILGDKRYLNQKRTQLVNQPITKEAINHNLRKSQEQQKLAREYSKSSPRRAIGLGYSIHYLSNALLLMQGKRALTREGFNEVYSHLFIDDTPTERR